jgi:hypothetical protein
MAVTDTLRQRGNLSGWYVRPAGSDSEPPRAGTRVDWVLSQPVADLLAQGKRLGWANKGTIGNTAHLKLHGDHTAHSKGKMRGVVYAKDAALPAGARDALLALCRMDSYDTTFIDFFNVGGRQYNYAGKDVGPSGDTHLHVSVRRGHELTRVTLFDDMSAVMAGTFRKAATPMPPIFQRLGFIDGAQLVKRSGDPAVWLTGRGKRAQIMNETELTAVRSYLRSRNMSDAIRDVSTLTGEVVP